MTVLLLRRLRDLQQLIKEQGLGGSLLALPAPKLLSLPATMAEAKEEIIFGQVVTEPEIAGVCKDLFESGFYNQAVQEAFKALDLYIKQKVGDRDLSGSQLMTSVFSAQKPRLTWSDMITTSEKDEQRGYVQLYSGSFVGIRNPCSHEIDWISDHGNALDAILLAQHLLRKAKSAKLILIPAPADEA